MRWLTCLAAAAALTACGDDKGAAPSTSAGVVDAWKAAGLTVSALSPAQLPVLAATSCQSGTINGVEITLCVFPDAAAARAAEPKGLTLVGAATGTSIAQTTMLLVVADRRKVDPSGRTIDRLTRVFRGRQAAKVPAMLSRK